MTPERVVIGDAQLWHGDCRDVLPLLDLAARALVTDPPYGLGGLWQGGGGTRRTSWRFDPGEARAWDRAPAEGLEQIAALFGEAVIWGGNYYRLPPSRCWLLWDKKQADTFTTGQAEMAWTNLDRPVRMFRMATCEQVNEGHAKEHPTQKPVALMAWCLKWITASAIVDPYMGSGTTGVACAQLGKAFTGIERERKYFDIACERIAHAQAQQPLFAPGFTAPPEQAAIFA